MSHVSSAVSLYPRFLSLYSNSSISLLLAFIFAHDSYILCIPLWCTIRWSAFEISHCIFSRIFFLFPFPFILCSFINVMFRRQTKNFSSKLCIILLKNCHLSSTFFYSLFVMPFPVLPSPVVSRPFLFPTNLELF